MTDPATPEAARLIQLPARARWKRALRWPMTVYAYRRTSLSWRMSFRLTHWMIWYQPAAPRGPR